MTATADLVDELVAADEEVRSCDLQLHSYGGVTRFAGPVRTVRWHEHNALLNACWAHPVTAPSSSSTAAARCTPRSPEI